MNKPIAALLAMPVVAIPLAAPAAATPPGDDVDDCTNANNGPTGDAVPPGFVAGIVGGVADFLGGLFSSLPVPNFVEGFFGRATC